MRTSTCSTLYCILTGLFLHFITSDISANLFPAFAGFSNLKRKFVVNILRFRYELAVPNPTLSLGFHEKGHKFPNLPQFLAFIGSFRVSRSRLWKPVETKTPIYWCNAPQLAIIYIWNNISMSVVFVNLNQSIIPTTELASNYITLLRRCLHLESMSISFGRWLAPNGGDDVICSVQEPRAALNQALDGIQRDCPTGLYSKNKNCTGEREKGAVDQVYDYIDYPKRWFEPYW